MLESATDYFLWMCGAVMLYLEILLLRRAFLLLDAIKEKYPDVYKEHFFPTIVVVPILRGFLFYLVPKEDRPRLDSKIHELAKQSLRLFTIQGIIIIIFFAVILSHPDCC
jgi:hypothetical protein